MEPGKEKKGFFNSPLTRTRITSANVKLPEILFGYFLGPLGGLLSSGILAGVMTRYTQDVLFGAESDAINLFLTLLPLLSIVFIIAGNLLVGQLVERTKTLQGKARPWILLSALTLSVAGVLMFIVPFENVIGKMIWFAVAYNVFYAVAFPIYNTATSTLVPVSTRNGKQRGLPASAVNMATLAATSGGAMIFPMLAYGFLRTDRTLWFLAMLAVAIFTFLTCVLQYYFTRERVTEEDFKLGVVKEKISIKKQLKAVAASRTWWLMMVAWFAIQIGGAVQNASITFYDYVAGTGGGDWGFTAFVLGVAGGIPMAIAVVLVWPLSNKFGKKNLAVAGLFLGAAGGVLAGIFATNFIIVAIGIALQCLGAAPVCYMALAMISDELDHIEAKNGFRCDGLTMSIYSLIAAIMTSIAIAVFSGLMGATGYIKPDDADKANIVYFDQPEAVQNAIVASYVWVRTAAFAIAAILLLFFTVEKNLKNDQKAIIERQKAEALAQGREWVEPSERLKIEQAEADRIADVARKEELRLRCEKKGLDYEAEESRYQKAQAEKRAAAEAKKAAKEAGKKG